MAKDAHWKQVNTIYAIAEKAGKAIVQYIETHHPIDIHYKPDRSVVTPLDALANTIIEQALQSISPYPVLSKEMLSLPSYTKRVQWPYYWLIDPLDGTRALLEGTGEYTVNIALIHQHRPVLSVVYVPHQEKGFLATYEGGAYKIEKDQRTLLRTRSRASQWTLGLSRFHTDTKAQAALSTLPGVTLKMIGSSLKICLIASGEIDGYVRPGPTYEWDLAAAHLILQEAGGALLDFSLTPLFYNKPSLLQPPFIAIGDKTATWKPIIDVL